jgi:hypothetical protein
MLETENVLPTVIPPLKLSNLETTSATKKLSNNSTSNPTDSNVFLRLGSTKEKNPRSAKPSASRAITPIQNRDSIGADSSMRKSIGAAGNASIGPHLSFVHK